MKPEEIKVVHLRTLNRVQPLQGCKTSGLLRPWVSPTVIEIWPLRGIFITVSFLN